MTTAQHILYNQSTGELSYDADGWGAVAAIKCAVLTPGTVLSTGHSWSAELRRDLSSVGAWHHRGRAHRGQQLARRAGRRE